MEIFRYQNDLVEFSTVGMKARGGHKTQSIGSGLVLFAFMHPSVYI